MNLLQRFKAWRRRRFWEKQKMEHLQVMLQTDARWMAHDPVAAALTARYLSAIGEGWESTHFEEVGALRERLGRTPSYGVEKRPLIVTAAGAHVGMLMNERTRRQIEAGRRPSPPPSEERKWKPAQKDRED